MRSSALFFTCLLLGASACAGSDDDGTSAASTEADSGSGDTGGSDDAVADGADDAITPVDGGESTGTVEPPPPGIACDSEFEYLGLVGCLSVVDGLDVKYFPLPEGTQVQRLVLFFHGDTGGDWFDDWGFRPEIMEWAQSQDMLVMGIKAPSMYDGDTEPSYGAAQPDHAELVTTTIETFIEQYGVVEERSLYWGISGGSWFFTSSFIPVAGARIPGIFAANCGGSGVSFGWTWDPATDTATRDLNALLLNYGDQDFLADPSQASYEEYTELGFATDQVVYPGATHCDHPIAEPTIAFWESQLP